MKQGIAIMVCGMVAVACSAAPIDGSRESDVETTLSANIRPEGANSSAASSTPTAQPACGRICTSHTISFNSPAFGPDCATASATAATNAQPDESSTCISQGFIDACLPSYVEQACFWDAQTNSYYAVVTVTAHCVDTNC